MDLLTKSARKTVIFGRVTPEVSPMQDQPYRSCEECGTEFPGRNLAQRFCRRICSRAYHRKRHGVESVGALHNLPKGTVGALNELRAAADLMQRGFHVFRALSPACPADLVAMKDGKCLLVEVKTATRGLNGRVRSMSPGHPYDVLAKVLPDGIIYEPSEVIEVLRVGN